MQRDRGSTTIKAIPRTNAHTRPDSRSPRLWREAQGVLPGGNSRTTVFMAPRPIYAAEGEGCWLIDVDGERWPASMRYGTLAGASSGPQFAGDELKLTSAQS